MNNYALGGDTLEIERKLREDKKKLNWNDDAKPHHWNSTEAKKISKKGHRWNSEEAKKANKKGHHWNSEEAKKAVKERWIRMNEESETYDWIEYVSIHSPLTLGNALTLFFFADEFSISKEIIIEYAFKTDGDVENIKRLIRKDGEKNRI